MKRVFCFCILLGITTTIYGADILATTEAGKKVLLQANGSWHYVTDDETASSSPDGSSASAQQKSVALIELFKNDVRYDFRKVSWGMTRKAVIASEETKAIKNSGDSLFYEVTFLGYTCSVVYLFTKDVLQRAIFIIRQPHVDPALFFSDYEGLKKYLTPVYGDAISDKNDWINEIYRSDRTKWGFAVSIGFLNCRTEWNTPRTRIVLSLSGGNHQIVTHVEYSVL